MILYFILAAYAYQKAIILFTKSNPQININVDKNHYHADELLDLNELGFKIAFGLYDYWTYKDIDDPNYIRW